MPKWTKFVSVLVLALLAAAALAAPPQIGTLYERDMTGSLNMTCTASLVDGSDLGYVEYPQLILTAAHCVDSGLRHDTDTDEWRSMQDFAVSFNDSTFYGVRLLRVGVAAAGYDLALLYLVDDVTIDIDPLSIGDWDDVELGTEIVNYANPMGLGLQAFHGYVTMLSLERTVVSGSINWRGNAVAMLPIAGGSSGSLVLNAATNEVIGVLIGLINPPAGSPFSVFVPQSKFEHFLQSTTAGRDITY